MTLKVNLSKVTKDKMKYFCKTSIYGRKQPRNGSVFILILLVVASMTILAIGLAYRCRLEIQIAQSSAQKAKAFYLALGGVERLKALLSQQELSTECLSKICPFQGTSRTEKFFESLKDHFDENTFLAYSLNDEQGYLNINKSDPAVWENLKCITRPQRAAIMDWMDSDSDTNPDGAETDYYERLDSSYICKNSPLIALKELLYVKAITHSDYFGKNLDNDHFLESLRNQNTKFFSDFIENTSDVGLVNAFTVFGDGKININTVPPTILAALPGLSSEVADTIATYRAGPDGLAGTDDDAFIQDANGMTSLSGLTELQLELLQQYCCFNSEYFRVFSYAKSQNSQCCLMATVKMTGNKPQVVCVEKIL
jgi:type II secretory pathway component PulK